MEIHSIYVLSYENNLIDLIEETRGTLRKRKTVTSISQTILKNSHLHIPTNLEKKKEIDLRKTPTCRTPRKENQDERTLQGIFGKRCQEQETQSGAKGNFPVEILLHSWQPTFTRFLQRARLMAQERRYSRRRLRPLSRSGLQVRRTRLVGTKAWATFGQRPNPYRDGDLLI